MRISYNAFESKRNGSGPRLAKIQSKSEGVTQMRSLLNYAATPCLSAGSAKPINKSLSLSSSLASLDVSSLSLHLSFCRRAATQHTIALFTFGVSLSVFTAGESRSLRESAGAGCQPGRFRAS